MVKRAMILAAAAAFSAGAQPVLAQSARATSQQEAAVDPARLEMAQAIALRQIPQGMMAEVMTEMFGGTMGGIYDAMGDLRLADVMRLGDMNEDEAAALGDATLDEVMRIVDPAWSERARLQGQVMGRIMAPVMERMEAPMRAAVASSYGRRFDATQLREILTFLETPTGNAFVRHQIAMTMDPAFMQEVMQVLPELMVEMQSIPDPEALLAEATADLPPPRTFENLTAAERSRLAQLLGTDEAALENNWAEEVGTLMPAKPRPAPTKPH